MKVLVACEYSGTVRDAFKAKGHDALSCDLLPTDKPGPHYEGDIFECLEFHNYNFDLMIAHPPCTYISNAGSGFFNIESFGDKAIERLEKRLLAIEFVKKLWRVPIHKICLENPVGWLNNNWRKPSQIIHPFYFGEPHLKRTCLWLKNLPRINGNEEVAMDKNKYYPEPLSVHVRKPSKNYKGGEIKKRYFSDVNTHDNGHKKSKTFQSIANAMAEQWG